MDINAFRSKIVCSPHGTKNREEVVDMLVVGKHKKGCNCKRSGCLKKYCERFYANIPCSENCRCTDCKNKAQDRKANSLISSHGYGFSSPTGLQHLQFQQENQMISSALPPFLSMGPPKLKFRSLLADIIPPEDLNKLCSVLVVHSATATNIPSDRNKIDKQATEYKSDESNSTKVKQTSKDLVFMNDSSNFNPSYAEQERVMLAKFRDCLTKIITLGNGKSL